MPSQQALAAAVTLWQVGSRQRKARGGTCRP